MCCTCASVRALAALALLAAAACAWAQPLERPACSIADRIPGGLPVYHVGSYHGTSGLGTAIELDDSGHEVRKVDVLVNMPGRAIVLALTAYDPVVWNVAWTPGTRIAGAIVSGYHAQAVVGIPRTLPLYRVTHAESGKVGCPYFYTYRDDTASARTADLIAKIAGAPVTRFIRAPRSGPALVGDAMPGSRADLESSGDYRVEDFAIERDVPAGRRGMEALAKLGFVRHATAEDVRAFEASGVKGIIRGWPTYVVLKPTTLPAGLYGANLVCILVPAGVPMPDGPRGHNLIFRYGQRECIGPAC